MFELFTTNLVGDDFSWNVLEWESLQHQTDLLDLALSHFTDTSHCLSAGETLHWFHPRPERKYLDWRQVSHWPRPTVTSLKRLANSQLKEAAMKKSSSRGKSNLLNSRHHEEISPYSTQRILREFLFPNDNRSRLTKRDSFQESKNQNKETSCCF